MSDGYRPSILCALKGMFSFFTMLPINIERKHMDDMNRCFWLVPIIGLFYGIFAAVVFVLCNEYLTTAIAAALTLFLMGFMNRFLHLDGTIDIGDGLTVAGTKEDHIRALKDTLVGAGGIATGLMVVLLTFSEYLSLGSVSFLFFGLSAEILARNAQVTAATFGIAGNGMAGDSVRFATKRSLILSCILTAALLALSYFAASFIAKELLEGVIIDAYLVGIVVGFAVSVVWGFIMARVANRNFDMVNGDVLGATNETSRMVVLFAMIAVMMIMARM
ncbi:MAG: adenosylcobinamide-GDP ribazoletransferase [Candidatus Methanomethylophilaceae archaeon]|nr:adenosylcobinamide-GDP ribazoletransferase [Candidatus Methanomethylophilaceae archaeon]